MPARRRAGQPDTARREAGFTLLEALVAFAIAAIALSVLFEGASAALRETSEAKRLEGAVERAQSHLAEAGVLIGGAGERIETGDDGARYHWRVSVAPERSAVVRRASAGNDPALPSRIRLYRIEVSERWSERGRERVYRLESTCLFVGAPGSA